MAAEKKFKKKTPVIKNSKPKTDKILKPETTLLNTLLKTKEKLGIMLHRVLPLS